MVGESPRKPVQSAGINEDEGQEERQAPVRGKSSNFGFRRSIPEIVGAYGLSDVEQWHTQTSTVSLPLLNDSRCFMLCAGTPGGHLSPQCGRSYERSSRRQD